MMVLHAQVGVPLFLGRQGENKARQIRFDLSEWQAIYGEGTVELLARRHGEEDPYPVVMEVDGSTAVWTVSAADTGCAGSGGKAELQYYVGDALVKSAVWSTIVTPSLGEGTEAPVPGQDWVDRLLQQIGGAGSGSETGDNSVPDYVKEEADRVAKLLLELQNENTVTFAAVSDIHVNYGGAYADNTQTAIRHAAMGIQRVASQVGIDFVTNLGDNLWGTNTDLEAAKMENLILNEAVYDAFRTHPNFRLIGNHDANLVAAIIPTSAIYGMNGRYNDFDVTGETKIRGYGYKDFERYKLRVIGLNTSDYIDMKGGYGMSDEQKRFLMSALDLSGKADGGEWQILLLSHIPLDFPESDYGTSSDVSTILAAYQMGAAISLPAGSYDYFGVNGATIIGNIHGHIHNFSRGTMASGVVRVCTPNTCFYNNGSSGTGVDENYMPNESYNKTAGTAQDTTVTFYTIDLEKKIIYSTNYGAGYDRQISYAGGETETYTVTNVLTGVASGNSAAAVVDGTAYRAVLTPSSGYTLTGAAVTVTMGGVDVTDSVYSDGVISIGSVTGDIVITIIAVQDESDGDDSGDTGETFSQTVADLACGVRMNPYYDTATSTLTFDNANARLSLFCTTANDAGAFTTRENTTVYLIPVPAKATKVTVTTTDTSVATMAVQGFDSNGDGTFTRVFHTSLSSDLFYEFAAGTAEYITLVLEYADSAGVPWGYDVNAYNIVTFS